MKGFSQSLKGLTNIKSLYLNLSGNCLAEYAENMELLGEAFKDLNQL